MSISLTLLAQPHSTAVRSIVQEALKPGVDINNLIIGQSTVRPDGNADLPVYIDSDAYSDPTWPYRGSVEMHYKRVDLQATLGALNLRFYAGPVFRTQDAIARFASVLQLHFDPTDYIHETIPMTTSGLMVVIKAAADSPRWKGQFTVFAYR